MFQVMAQPPSGSTVTISKAGTYVISGKSDGVQTAADAEIQTMSILF